MTAVYKLHYGALAKLIQSPSGVPDRSCVCDSVEPLGMVHFDESCCCFPTVTNF